MPNLLDDSSWLEFEKDHVWHPYAPLEGALPPYPVKNAQGVHLTLEDGRQLIDGMSSWWSVIHGYNHPVINAAAKARMKALGDPLQALQRPDSPARPDDRRAV